MEKVQYTMIDRQSKKPGRSGERGAALVVAIAIMTILLAVGLTFYAISRQEVINTVNVKNQVQVDLLLDAAHAMAQAELNRDFIKNPNATSLDAAPFSLFNGSWAVGKQWARRNGISLQAGGVPLVDMTDLPLVRFNPVDPAESSYEELLYNGPLSRDWLYFPRFEDTGNYLYGLPPFSQGVQSINYLDRNTLAPFTNYRNGALFSPSVFALSSRTRPPFVTPAFYGPSGGFTDEKYPLEWIHTWTDVDNDDDGLNDAIWIPLPQDKFFSGGEVVDDVTERRMYDDGIDNDLDLAPHLLPNGLAVFYDELPEASEGPMELATFVYNGARDGLNNDGDVDALGRPIIDEADEDRLFLTAPIAGIKIPLDLNADGVVPDLVPDDDNGGRLTPLYITLPGTIDVRTSNGVVSLTNADVDVIDNDYDMLVNDYQVYAYVGPNGNNAGDYPPFRFQGFEDTGVPNGAGGTILQPILNNSAVNSDLSRFATAIQKSYSEINQSVLVGAIGITPRASTVAGFAIEYALDLDVLDIVITHSGEPVCDLAGRAAITIRDEASKVNLNVAGGHTQNPLGGGLIRALGGGKSPWEYDTRVLPDIGTGLAFNMFAYRMGTPTNATNLYSAPGTIFDSYVRDVEAPGYGHVDDNANILLLALNGVDDDGDGLVDEGLYLPEPGDSLFAGYYEQLGLFEGTDDPGELQRYRALGNLLAENRDPFEQSGFGDNVDNDLDGAQNETGELGDLQLQDTLQIQEVPGIGAGRYGQLRQSISAFSTDRNANFVRSQTGGTRAVNKLDYNFANPQQIAGNLILSNGTQAITAQNDFFPHDPTLNYEPEDVTRGFAEGLRQGNVHIRSRLGNRLLANTVGSFPADPVLEILQAAVDIVDNRDSDHSRSILRSERQNRVPQTAATGIAYDTWPNRLGAREGIPEDQIIPLGELEAYSINTLGLNRKLEIRDDWWTFYAVDPTGTAPNPGVVGETGLPEERQISYTAAGNEAIKINELMVRPVRRVEAEMINPALAMDASDPMSTALNPGNFNPTAGHAELPAFDLTRLTASSGIGWQLGNEGLLGDSTYLSLTYDGDPVTPPVNDDSTLEFVISPTALGLPAGRYYLTVNTTAGVNGNTVTTPPVTGTPMLEYSIKYVDPAGVNASNTSIIADAGTAIFENLEYLSSDLAGAPDGWAFLSGQGPTGTSTFGGYFPDGHAVIGTLPDTRPTGNATHAVYIPEAATNIDVHVAFRLNSDFADELDLANQTVEVAINFLEFSQEPDHEWIELANTSDQPVNIGGWELEVGIPDSGDEVPEDPFKSKWRVPIDTIVAPGGMVLLAFNKFDHYQRDPLLDPASLLPYPGHSIGANGMGLAASDLGGFISYTQSLSDRAVTVPPIATAPGAIPNTMAGYRDPTGSAFYRPFASFVDYIERDGDGVSSIYNTAAAVDTDSAALEQSIQSSSDGNGDINGDGLDDASNIAMAARPWDRIVEMQCLQWRTDDPFGPAPVSQTMTVILNADTVAAMVLRGGILPNYPEHDGFDNDGDGGYMDFNGLYIPGTLEKDMIDNNLDGVVDERGIEYNPNPGSAPDNYLINGVDDDLDLTFDEQDEWYLSYNMSASEGVDEGRLGATDVLFNWRNYGPGSFEEFTLPSVFINHRGQYNAQFGVVNSAINSMAGPADGGAGFGFLAVNGTNAVTNGFVNRLGRYDEVTDPFASPVAIPANFYNPATTSPYLGADTDPADWKAFAERRWNPGDNVIVTLYEGAADLGKVADRVTYREYDVINRTIDDIEVPNYVIADADESGAVGDTPADFPVLNRSYSTMWNPNHMALDFYRSIERKSPLYSGDRFGTENRWQATDGAYDDWSDSLSFFESEIATDPSAAGPQMVTFADQFDEFGRPRFLNFRQERLFRHAMSGSPLRMNAAARKSMNPADLERVLADAAMATDPPMDVGQFFDPLDYFRTHEDGDYGTTGFKSLPNQSWNHSRAGVANRFYQSPGDLMRVPHQTYLHDAVNTRLSGRPFLRDMTMLNIGLQGDAPLGNGVSYIQDIALRGATLGQDDYAASTTGNLLTAAVNSMSTDSVVLTVGQAEFRPIRPDLSIAAVGAPGPYINWVNNTQTESDSLLAPAAWAPVFLYAFDRAPQNWDTTLTNTERFPYYPAYVSGTNLNAAMDPIYLFNGSYFLDNQGPAYLTTALPDHFEDRLPLERRVTMYVSQVRPPAQFPPSDVPAGVEDQRPEGLFIWDGEDGLENGEYTLYVGTYIPQMRERVLNAAVASKNGVFNVVPPMAEPDLLYQSGANVAVGDLTMDRVTYEVLTMDPTHPDVGNTRFNSVFALDVITDPTEARGVAPRITAAFDPSVKPGGLIHPDDWNPPVEYRASSDGYIHYGNNAAGGWRSQTVQVTDNFLAVRVRNVGDQGDIGIITHVVLAPRKRTAGRVNVNTVQSRIASFPLTGIPTEHQYFNTLLGLPGVVDAGTSVVSTGIGVTPALDPADDVALMMNTTLPVDGSWSGPSVLYGTTPPHAPLAAPPVRNLHNDPPTSDWDVLVPDGIGNLTTNTAPRHRVAAYRLSSMLMAGRTEHADGRYYRSVGDLVNNGSAFDYDFGLSRADQPDLSVGRLGVDDAAIYPLSNESLRWKRFDETKARLNRLGNLVTVRSDVFEIIMTVEAGYGVDKDGDGFINYRDREEFVTTAATKASATYERRTPSDTQE